MKYNLQVEAEGEDLLQAASSDRSQWKVISGAPQRPTPQPQTGQVTSSRTFSQTAMQPTPKVDG